MTQHEIDQARIRELEEELTEWKKTVLEMALNIVPDKLLSEIGKDVKAKICEG